MLIRLFKVEVFDFNVMLNSLMYWNALNVILLNIWSNIKKTNQFDWQELWLCLWTFPVNHTFFNHHGAKVCCGALLLHVHLRVCTMVALFAKYSYNRWNCHTVIQGPLACFRLLKVTIFQDFWKLRLQVDFWISLLPWDPMSPVWHQSVVIWQLCHTSMTTPRESEKGMMSSEAVTITLTIYWI